MPRLSKRPCALRLARDCRESSVHGLFQLLRLADHESVGPKRAARLGPHRFGSGQYSLLARSPEWEILPVCREHNVSVTAWSPLAAGWLSGRYAREAPPPPDSRMGRIAKTKEEWDRILQVPVHTQVPHPTRLKSEADFQAMVEVKTLDHRWRIIEAVGNVAKSHGKTHAQVALAWLLAEHGVCSVLVGAKTPMQLDENLGADGLKLSDESLEWLNRVSDPGLPYPFDFFRRYGIPMR